jgi:hypothetical protein
MNVILKFSASASKQHKIINISRYIKICIIEFSVRVVGRSARKKAEEEIKTIKAAIIA